MKDDPVYTMLMSIVLIFLGLFLFMFFAFLYGSFTGSIQ